MCDNLGAAQKWLHLGLRNKPDQFFLKFIYERTQIFRGSIISPRYFPLQKFFWPVIFPYHLQLFSPTTFIAEYFSLRENICSNNFPYHFFNHLIIPANFLGQFFPPTNFFSCHIFPPNIFPLIYTSLLLFWLGDFSLLNFVSVFLPYMKMH